MYLSDRNTTIASLIFNIFCLKSLLKKMLIRMYGHRRGSGCTLTAAIVASGKKGLFSRSSRSRLRRSISAANNSKNIPLEPRVSGAMLPREIFEILTP